MDTKTAIILALAGIVIYDTVTQLRMRARFLKTLEDKRLMSEEIVTLIEIIQRENIRMTKGDLALLTSIMEKRY